jgi:hypothetical protein
VLVTDDQVIALRAILAGDPDLHREAYGRFNRPGGRTGYMVLVTAAFFEAVDRRFAKTGTPSDVIDFVADVRSRSDRLAEEIDPTVAERLIRSCLTDEDVDDLNDETRAGTMIVLLGGLVADEQFDAEGLDAFLADARKLANSMSQ